MLLRITSSSMPKWNAKEFECVLFRIPFCDTSLWHFPVEQIALFSKMLNF